MGDPNAPEAPSRRFAQGAESAAEARRFVRAVLDGAAPDVVDTAQLLVSELVTNVVLHARTEAEVSARIDDGTVRVRVSDQRPDRGLVPRHGPLHEVTGQGLALVEQLASRHGVHTGEEDKTVWFELRPDGSPPRPNGWEDTVPPSASGVTVTLVDVPGALYAASQQHWHTLLRELTLAVAAGDGLGVQPEDVAVAQDMSNVISACVTAALWEQPAGAETPSLRLSVPPDAGPAVKALRAVLDLAEEEARNERLLTLPALPRTRAFHEWLCDQIAGQLAGGHPTAWTVVPLDPGASPSELAPWEAGQVQASPEEGPWELVHSSAGHLPPLLIGEDGRTRYLTDGSGLLLGMDPDMPRPRARDMIPARSTALLYTDGLIERRDESLDNAMDRLRRHAAALAREPLDVFCDELLIGLGADGEDDIAVLAVRPTPPP